MAKLAAGGEPGGEFVPDRLAVRGGFYGETGGGDGAGVKAQDQSGGGIVGNGGAGDLPGRAAIGDESLWIPYGELTQDRGLAPEESPAGKTEHKTGTLP